MAAIVSGGTKGIGRAICEILLQNGLDLSICARNQTDLKEFKQYYTRKFPHSRIHIFQADLSVQSEVYDYARSVTDEYEAIEILVNNAGSFVPGQIIHEGPDALDLMIRTNLYSAYHLTKALIKPLIDQKKGHVFNMCSVASFMAYPNGGSYAISKFALLGFSKSLRRELMDFGVKVTAVMPGATWSDSWSGVDLPKDRLMNATDIAKSIWSAYTLSDSAVVEEIIIRPQLGDL